MRTSQSHPIKIAELLPQPGYGKIGLTLCPGKVQPNGFSGSWNRDLQTDLNVIAQWGAAAVVSLIEPAEMEALRVTDLGAEVTARHMAWYHLPIPDVSIPQATFENSWTQVGEGLRARLRDGANVLIHCKGGLGRAGTVAARLLVELGLSPPEAIEMVRRARPGAIETAAQERYVVTARPTPEVTPSTGLSAIRDRAVGAMLGLAVGDAVGTTLEFCPRDSRPILTDMIGGGPFSLEPGQWTDDTSMALALMTSLLADSDLDEADLMARFVSWYRDGAFSVLGRCFDIGNTTRQALERWEQGHDPVAGSTRPTAAGNGSLMRLAPVAVRHWQNSEMLRSIAARQSRTTHGAREAVDACVAFAEVLADAIKGVPRSAVLRPRASPYVERVAEILAGSWRGKQRDHVRSSGYVVHSLEAAFWCVGSSASFSEAVLTAANLGDDADTTAAITGQLAGAIYGASSIPAAWLERLAWKGRIERWSSALFEAGLHAGELGAGA